MNPAEVADVPTTGVRRMHEAPLVLATEASLKGYGHVVRDPKSFQIEITRWPAQGWRPIDGNLGWPPGLAQQISQRHLAAPA